MIRLVIFDCDGVLIDSEPVANRLLVAEMAALGWVLSEAEAMARFVGRRLSDIAPMVREATGRDAPAGWVGAVHRRLVERVAAEAVPVPGALAALRAVSALGLPWRIASNSSHAELEGKFATVGWTALVAGRVHSAADVPAGKPAPDLFLAAARAEGVAPADCVVVEDSEVGVRAAIAAGMVCLGFAPHGDGAGLRALGAHPFHDLAALPALIGARAAA